MFRHVINGTANQCFNFVIMKAAGWYIYRLYYYLQDIVFEMQLINKFKDRINYVIQTLTEH